MIHSINYSNFKGLKDCTIKLGRFNLLIGPNGTGKSSVLQSLEYLNPENSLNFKRIVNRDVDTVEIRITLGMSTDNHSHFIYKAYWDKGNRFSHEAVHNNTQMQDLPDIARNFFRFQCKVYAFDTSKIAEYVPLLPDSQMNKDGSNLAAALDNLRDQDEEAFRELRREFLAWLPEFDNIAFETPAQGHRGFMLRLAKSKKNIPAKELSEGTLLALALLTLCYQPKPPAVIGLEEPDRGIHPRLLRELKNALYRLCYPEEFGSKRPPVQIIATTHSPVFLDLFKDKPEEIIVADKDGDGHITFKNLADQPDLQEILGETSLGEAWYSGVLGGVPAHT